MITGSINWLVKRMETRGVPYRRSTTANIFGNIESRLIAMGIREAVRIPSLAVIMNVVMATFAKNLFGSQ